jgi:hypothetical protein
MALSAEYPDLPFVPPAAFGKGRPASPRVIVIHYTAGAERSTSAEDGAAYDQRRTDGTSTHYFVDSDSVVQCVYTWDRANAAFYSGNRIGIQYELCGTMQTRAQWLDAASSATLTNAARQVARDAKKYNIPVRKLSPAQVAAGVSGICGHADITLAFPADGGDHMDPGEAFPWDVLLERIENFGGADMAGEYSPSTALALAIGVTEAGYVDRSGVSWDDALGQYNIKNVVGKLDALAAVLDGVVKRLDAIQPGAGGVNPDAVAKVVVDRLQNG